MTERTRDKKAGEDAEAKARDKAFEAWQPTAPGEEEPLETFVVPRQKMTFPPSFLLILAAACALFALEPTADLPYQLFGPSSSVDLGQPAAYTLSAARDGARAHIKGYLGVIVKTVEPWGVENEVGILKGVPVLVRRSRHPPAPADTVQIYEGEGRLVKLEGESSSFIERMINPTSRFNTLRLQYEALGELGRGEPAWLLLEGDIPRSNPGLIARALGLWVAAIALSAFAWRSHAVRSAKAARRRRI